MIVVIGGIKGGSGKTTLATNLAVLRSTHSDLVRSGGKALLVDADEQKSSSDWADQRQSYYSENDAECELTTIQLSGKTVGNQIFKMAADYHDIIVDVGGRDTNSQRSALTVADVCVIPFKPRSLDVWTLESVKGMIEEIMTVNPKLICLTLINMADSHGSDNVDAVGMLKEWDGAICLETSIGDRKAFSNAMSLGMGVIEGPRPLDKKAMREIIELHNCIFKTCLAYT